MENWTLVQNKHKLKKKIRNKNKITEKAYDTKDGMNLNCLNETCTKSNHYDKKQTESIFNEIKRVTSNLEKSIFFENFKKKFYEANKNSTNKVIICLGLGSLENINFNNKKTCIYQLSFVLLLKKTYNIPNVYIFDPKITKIDKSVYDLINVKVLINPGENENQKEESEGADAEEEEEKMAQSKNNYEQNVNKIAIDNNHEKVLLFMPHCDISLCGEVLYNIFIFEKLFFLNVKFFFKLENTIFLGNSFDYYKNRIYLYKPLGMSSHMVHMLYVNENTLNIKTNKIILEKLKNNYKESHFIFHIINIIEETKFPIFFEHIYAFNDMSITVFNEIKNKLLFFLDIYKRLIT